MSCETAQGSSGKPMLLIPFVAVFQLTIDLDLEMIPLQLTNELREVLRSMKCKEVD